MHTIAELAEVSCEREAIAAARSLRIELTDRRAENSSQYTMLKTIAKDKDVVVTQ